MSTTLQAAPPRYTVGRRRSGGKARTSLSPAQRAKYRDPLYILKTKQYSTRRQNINARARRYLEQMEECIIEQSNNRHAGAMRRKNTVGGMLFARAIRNAKQRYEDSGRSRPMKAFVSDVWSEYSKGSNRAPSSWTVA